MGKRLLGVRKTSSTVSGPSSINCKILVDSFAVRVIIDFPMKGTHMIVMLLITRMMPQRMVKGLKGARKVAKSLGSAVRDTTVHLDVALWVPLCDLASESDTLV